MSEQLATDLQGVLDLPAGSQIDPLVELAVRISDQNDSGSPSNGGVVESLIYALLGILEHGEGTARQRVYLGEALARLGDPRLRTPDQPDYWSAFDHEGHSFSVGRHPVSTLAFQTWVREGGYDNAAHWSEAGLAWRDQGDPTWGELALDPKVAHLVVPNQPVVGVNFHEAEAYAMANGARLLTVEERRWVVRGAEKRPYPWGAPFGEGNANTREEALGKPCALGIYSRDQTPEGVFDLAGNVAEWLQGGTPDLRTLHPGSWVRPSMAAWAKALEMVDPATRSADLGLRLLRP